MSVAVEHIDVGDAAESWIAAGFTVDADGLCQVGGVRFRLLGDGAGGGPPGFRGWALSGLAESVDSFDGIPTETVAVADRSPGPEHPNGVTGIAHLVLTTPDLARTVAAFAALGLEPRGVREVPGDTPLQQIFFRLADVIVEVLGSPTEAADGPARLWGIAYEVADVDATAELLAAHVGRVKDAVQPGRRIVTLRNRELGLSAPTVFISRRD